MGLTGRWQAMAAAAACMAVGMSAVFMGSFPVFLEPVSRDLAWGRAILPQIITVISFCAALLMPFTGRLFDRVGVRLPVAVGLALVAGGMMLLSLLRTNGPIFWIASLSLGAGAALSGPPAFVAVVSSWFDKNRALALGSILAIAPMCSQAVVAQLAQHLIETVGWRQSFRILGAVILVVGILASVVFLRPNPVAIAAPGTLPSDKSNARGAIRTLAFWQLSLASILASGAVIGFSVHVVSWLTERGLSGETAAVVLSALFLTGVAGTLLSAYVADRTLSSRPIQLFYALPLVGIGVMAISNNLPLILVGATLVGLGMSAVTGLVPFLVTRHFGLAASGEIFGIILGMTMVGIGLGPVLIGIGFDQSGGYGFPLSLTAVALAIAAAAIGLLPRADGFSHDNVAANQDLPFVPDAKA